MHHKSYRFIYIYFTLYSSAFFHNKVWKVTDGHYITITPACLQMVTPWGASYIRWSMPTPVNLTNQAKLYLGLPCWVPPMIVDREDMNMDLDLLICANWGSSIICKPTMLLPELLEMPCIERKRSANIWLPSRKQKEDVILRCFKDTPYL